MMKHLLQPLSTRMWMLAVMLLLTAVATAQPATKDEDIHRDPMVMKPDYTPPDGDAVLSNVITIGDYDNFKLGVDFAECSIANNPLNPTQYYAVWNSTGSAGGRGYYTLDGHNWTAGNPTWSGMRGDVVVAYDSAGNLAYQNMYGSASIQGVKVAMSANNGQTWSAPVNANPGVDKNWLAADQTAGPYSNTLTGTMTANSGGSVSRSSNLGVSWQNSPNLSPQTLPGMSVCIGPKGNIQGGAQYIVTNSGSSFASVYTFFESNDGGATFQQRSTQQFANTVGSQVNGRNAVLNMRTRPYPNIAADNSYGPHRGRLYLVYASNNPTGNGNKPDIFCRYSDNNGTTWSPAVVVNDDPNSQNNHNWFPAIWCEKNTGRLYISWMDTRDCPTSDSALMYATYSDDGINFAPNQQISTKKMKINCTSCGGGGTPMYLGDYNGLAANDVTAMLAWTDFRDNNFGSYTAYFPDYAMRMNVAGSDTLTDSLDVVVTVPSVKLYDNTVEFSAEVNPAPGQGSFEFVFPNGNTLNAYPDSVILKVTTVGTVPAGAYNLTVTGRGPNGTPVHKRSQIFYVINTAPYAAFAANSTAICSGTDVNFTDQSAGNPTSWLWTFAGGQPATSTEQNPSGINYATAGSFDVTLQVTNSFGTNTVTQTAYITATDQPEAPQGTDAQVCQGLPNPALNASGTDVKWYFNSSLTQLIASGNQFVPANTLPGTFTYYATQTVGNCTSPGTPVALTIHPKPSATLAPFDTACSAYAPFELTGGLPEGGTWQGNGVSNGVFDPSAAGVGEHKITYTYTNAENCSDSATASLVVNQSPTTSLNPFSPLCANNSPITLTGGLPDGGTYSGEGVAAGMFDPTVAGTGEHLITYTIPPVNGCEGMSRQPITVWSVPQPALGADTVLCSNLVLTLDGTTPDAVSYLWEPGGATTSAIAIDSAGVGNGSVVFTLSATSENNCTGTDQVMVTFKDCTGIADFSGVMSVSIFPNPGQGIFHLQLDATRPLNLNLKVVNTLGKVVYDKQNVSVDGRTLYTLNLSDQPEGMYVLTVYDSQSSLSRKIVIYR